MPSPGSQLPQSPPRGWGRAAIGALALLVAVTIVLVKMAPNTSLSAGETPEGKQPTATESSSVVKEDASHSEDASQPVLRGMPAVRPAVSSASLAAVSRTDRAISSIPAVDLTAEALTRYLRERRSSEIRDGYRIDSSPSGLPADTPTSPAIASPAK